MARPSQALSTGESARLRGPAAEADRPDHVDRVREQWRAVRPELDTGPIAIVARMGRAAAYFDQAINALMAEHGLARSSWDVLASLRRSGPPYELSPTELYRGLMRTSGAMTNRLQRLERSGLVERTPDPVDGRGMLVRLTATGRDLVDVISPLHMEREQWLLRSLSAEECELLEGLLRKLLVEFEQTDPGPPQEAGKRRSHRTT